MKKLRKTICEILCFVLMAAALTVIQPQKVSAASRLISLKPNVTYRTYDVTGDGKRDVFKYSINANRNGNAYIYMNGRYKQTFFVARGGNLYLADFGKNNVFLLNNYSQYGGHAITAMKYTSGKFRTVRSDSYFSSSSFGFKNVLRVKGSTLYVSSSPRPFHTKSFENAEEPIECFTRYKASNGRISLISRAASVGGRNSFTAMNTFKTSLYRTNLKYGSGPTVNRGSKVTLQYVYFGKNGQILYRVKVGSRTGWFEDSDMRLLK